MKILLFTTLLLLSNALFSQNVIDINERKTDIDFENIYAQKLDSDSNSTSFIIWVKNEVRSHKHKNHSELIYVIEGEAMMMVDGSTFPIKPGDYFRIPANTFHAVKEVTTREPLKVLSVQAPMFLGKDRVLEESK